MLRMTVQWQQYGSVEWEQWWVQKHGQNLGRQATPEEHVGFANFDLSHVGLPKLTPGPGGSYLLPLIPDNAEQTAIEILGRHGFIVSKTERL